MNANECVELMKKTTHKTRVPFEGSYVEVWTGYCDLTYEMALALLTMRNKNFRGITRTRVDKYKNVFREKKWMVCHQGISVTSSKTGHCDRLGDGQHRLTAFVETCQEDKNFDKRVTVQCNLGFPERTEDVVDQQQKRNCQQILKHMGLKKGSSEIAGAARIVIHHFNAKRFQGDELPISDQGLCEFVMRHEQKWIETLELITKRNARDSIYPRAQMMALVFIATGSTIYRSQWSVVLKTFIKKFWDGLRLEDEQDSFHIMRQRCRALTNKKEDGGKDTKKRQWSTDRGKIVWESWNRYAKSKDGTFKVPQAGRINHPLNVKLIANVEHFEDPVFDQMPNYQIFNAGKNIRQQKNRYGRGWS